jgi:hypothetical protein
MVPDFRFPKSKVHLYHVLTRGSASEREIQGYGEETFQTEFLFAGIIQSQIATRTV